MKKLRNKTMKQRLYRRIQVFNISMLILSTFLTPSGTLLATILDPIPPIQIQDDNIWEINSDEALEDVLEKKEDKQVLSFETDELETEENKQRLILEIDELETEEDKEQLISEIDELEIEDTEQRTIPERNSFEERVSDRQVKLTAKDFDELLAAIEQAPSKIPTIIEITSDIDFDRTITINNRKDITLQSSGSDNHALAQRVNQLHFLIQTNSSLTLGDHVSIGKAGQNGGGIQIVGGTFNMKGGAISQNNGLGGAHGGGVILSSGVFNMTGGIISENRVTVGGTQGGGVFMTGGTFNMENGTISGNSASHSGGGISMRGGTFNMAGGTISGNTTLHNFDNGGGGVHISGGTFYMTGGTISGNDAPNTRSSGGGVFLQGGEFHASGGTISNNTARNGGGIFVSSLNSDNLSLAEHVVFNNNTANSNFQPPLNVESVFPNIKTTDSSIAGYHHPLNHVDIGYSSISPAVRNLSFNNSVAGGGTVNIVGEANVRNRLIFQDTSALVEAVPIMGYQFVNWESSNGGSFDDRTHPTTTFTMPNNDTTITATFRRVITSEDLDHENWLMEEVSLQARRYYGDTHLSVEAENIPYEFLQEMTTITLPSRNLTGSIPASIGKLTQLSNLNLSHNQLEGEIPSELGQLTQLTNLMLSHNQLKGEIPPTLDQLTRLMRLDLSHNQLEGEIPPVLGQLTFLTNLILSHNQLEGKISSDLDQLTHLRSLDLSHNQLKGEIPPTLGQLTQLTYLELNNNQLEGEIPPALGQLTFLFELNLSHNKLVGRIPDEVAFHWNASGFNLSHNGLTIDSNQTVIFDANYTFVNSLSAYQLTSVKTLEVISTQIEPFNPEANTFFDLKKLDSIGESSPLLKGHIFSIFEGEDTTQTPIYEGLWDEELKLTVNPLVSHYTVVMDHASNNDNNVTQIQVEIEKVRPVDPFDPEREVDPENKPQIPDVQGFLSIDFISPFDFGQHMISVEETEYFARPQRLLDENGLIIKNGDRPNYIQISDRREDNKGWTLSVTQEEQFHSVEGHELRGAELTLQHAEVVSATGGSTPTEVVETLPLTPGDRHELIVAKPGEGQGTWIYRFGDHEHYEEGVMLTVPRGANPNRTTYQTTLNWQLSTTPGN